MIKRKKKKIVPSNVLKSLYSILMTWEQSEGRSTFLRLNNWFGVNVEGGDAESAALRMNAAVKKKNLESTAVKGSVSSAAQHANSGGILIFIYSHIFNSWPW